MATTAIWLPRLTDEENLRQFDHKTKFCIIPDHYNTSPTGWPNQNKLLQQEPFLNKIIREQKNIIFLSQIWSTDLESFSNFYYFPMHWLYHHHQLKLNNPTITKSKKTVCANLLGGKTRINRTLASHWLAKNYPTNHLLWNLTHNNSLVPIADIIKSSSYYKKSHIRKNLFLSDTFVPQEMIGEDQYQIFINYLLPKFLSKTLLSIVIDIAGVELANILTEKSLYAFAGKTLIFLTGTYQIDMILKKLGFVIFDKIFDYENLHSQDRYELTVKGLENNKEKILSYEFIQDAYSQFSKEIIHNYDLACSSDHLRLFFEDTNKIMKEATQHIDTNLFPPDHMFYFKD